VDFRPIKSITVPMLKAYYTYCRLGLIVFVRERENKLLSL